ncbi:zinc finger protein GLI4-like [Branchiostoma floridae]|uniref:Zinc finger protein GLI4-like n=1 Tax=Branchiostoma floridae TaxID=7739 RepID=C3ZES9_BRAFL|nr:zinc finger protein GLI4-like [Branchiostoma floridae]|eukprot:XP_002593224.1 hypothetical protein BRAFLDRAFT_72699 [Branchiostoma floridae]
MAATVSTHVYGGPVPSFPTPASWTVYSPAYGLPSPDWTPSHAPVEVRTRSPVSTATRHASPPLKATPEPSRRSSGFSFASMPSDIAKENEKRSPAADFPASVVSTASPGVPYSVDVTFSAPFNWYSPAGKVAAAPRSLYRVSPYSRPAAPTTSARFPCDICGKVYASRHALSGHVGGAHRQDGDAGDRQHECKECGKTFNKSSTLAAHQRVHTGERPYICPICNRGFSQRSSLVPHLRTHSGEKPYRCTFCPRAFADASTLVKHVRTHTNEKPYKCEVCGIGFTQSGNLKRHQRVHVKKEDAQQ